MKVLLKIVGGLVLVGVIWCVVGRVVFRQQQLAGYNKFRLTWVGAAASEYHKSLRRWPSSLADLVAQPDSNMAVFLKSGSNDAWGHPIVFEPFDSTRGYGRLISYGQDGRPGGEGYAKDVALHYGEDQQRSFAPVQEK